MKRFERFVSNSNQFVYLHNLIKTFSSEHVDKKPQFLHSQYCDLFQSIFFVQNKLKLTVLYLFYLGVYPNEGLNTSLIYDGKSRSNIQKQQLQYEILLLPRLGANSFFKDRTYLCESKGVIQSYNNHIIAFFVMSEAYVLDFY